MRNIPKNSTMGVENFLRFPRRVIVPAFFIAGFFIFTRFFSHAALADTSVTVYPEEVKNLKTTYSCGWYASINWSIATGLQQGGADNNCGWTAATLDCAFTGEAGNCLSAAESRANAGSISRPTYLFKFSGAIPPGEVIKSAYFKADTNGDEDKPSGLERKLFPQAGADDSFAGLQNFASPLSDVSNYFCGDPNNATFNFNYFGVSWLNSQSGNDFSFVLRNRYDYDRAIDPSYDLGYLGFKNPSLRITFGPSPFVVRPIISGLGQFEAVGSPSIATGATAKADILMFKGVPMLPAEAGDKVLAQIQLEVRPTNEVFTNTPTAASSFVASGGTAAVIVPNLPAGSYHWQARAVDSLGNVFAWQAMSDPAEDIDFVISDQGNHSFSLSPIEVKNLKTTFSCGWYASIRWWNATGLKQSGSDNYCGWTAETIDCAFNGEAGDCLSVAQYRASAGSIFRPSYLFSLAGQIPAGNVIKGVYFKAEVNKSEDNPANPDRKLFPQNSADNSLNGLEPYASALSASGDYAIAGADSIFFRFNDDGISWLNSRSNGNFSFIMRDHNDYDQIEPYNNLSYAGIKNPELYVVYGPPSQVRNPVIIVPGFFGSWGSEDRLALDPILHTYDNLWGALKLAGYEKDKTLFAFPYNWRQSNVTSSLLLKQKIEEVKVVCSSANIDGYDCDKVDLVAHSMGGLVARAYAESNKYQNDIDQLIFLATPQRGSPMAYLSWEGGESGIEFNDIVMEMILLSEANEHGYPSNFLYITNLPMTSVQELLPIFNYLRDKGSDNLRTYPYENYPRNRFLEDLNNPYELAELQGIKILNIVADAGSNSTMNFFRIGFESYPDGRWEHGYPEDYGRLFTDRGIEYGAGDDTVPAISNRNFNNFDEVLVRNSSHLKIVSDAQGVVVEELTGTSPNQEVNKNFIQKMFMARIFSPADFVIIAPDGKRIGKDFTTGQDINEIDGAYYSGKFATIPDPLDGEYEVELKGTGNGEYKLSISGIDDATSADKDFIGQITTGAIQDFKIDYLSSRQNLLEDLQPQDMTSPSLTINSPVDGVVYKHNDKMIISHDVSDDFSGVSSTAIKIDGKLISSTTVNLFDYQIGPHILSIVVFDMAGNSTEKEVDFRITADIKSTIVDIEEIYSRGWLKSLSRKNILIGELKILDGGLNLIDRAKTETIKKIEDAKNNPKLSTKAKEKLIANLNSILAGLAENRQKIISLNLGIFEKTLNEFQKFNYLNQSGYDMLKSDLEYLKIYL